MTLQEQYEKETGNEPYGVNGDYTKWLENKVDNNNKAIVDRLKIWLFVKVNNQFEDEFLMIKKSDIKSLIQDINNGTV